MKSIEPIQRVIFRFRQILVAMEVSAIITVDIALWPGPLSLIVVLDGSLAFSGILASTAARKALRIDSQCLNEEKKRKFVWAVDYEKWIW